MRLTLRLSDRGTDTGQSRTLEAGRLTIGRGAENDWALPDPDRTLSKQHCFIDASDGAYLLTDVSTNGVFMSGASQPLGRGHSCALEDGDSFAIGPYRISAEVAGQNFGQGLSLPAAEEAPAPPPTPFPISPAPEAPWLNEIPAGGFGPDRRAAPLGWDAPPDPARFAASGVLQAPDPLDPRSGGFAPAVDRFSQEAEHIAAPSTVMRVPQAQVMLPADWNEVDAPAATRAAVAEAAPSWPPALPAEPPPPPTLPADWIAEEPLGAEDAFSSTQTASLLQDDWAPVPAEIVAPVPPPAPQPVWREPEPAAPPRPAPVAAPSGVMAAFLEGAGLPAATLADVDAEETFRDIGKMVRAAVEGVRDILSTRALVKSEFRVEQTVLKRSDNNAVKFAPDAQKCVAAMVGAAPPGFLPGSAAMRQSMDDIKLHELALVAAINSVFADLSKQLDPEAIMTRARQDTGLGTMLPYAREARCWAIYTETHALLQDSGAPNTAGSLLAPVAQAYARQLRRS